MSRLAEKLRTRTGQAPGLMVPGGVARMGGGNGNGGNGGCMGLPPATPQSWGAACPSGACSSEDLAASLNRQFAGERYGCRELPYWVTGTADAAGVVTIAQNSLVTICPTRVIALEAAGVVAPTDSVMSVFEIANQNQIIGDPIPLAMLLPTEFQLIPFVTDCMKAGLPFRIVLTGCTVGRVYNVGLIGPAIG